MVGGFGIPRVGLTRCCASDPTSPLNPLQGVPGSLLGQRSLDNPHTKSAYIQGFVIGMDGMVREHLLPDRFMF